MTPTGPRHGLRDGGFDRPVRVAMVGAGRRAGLTHQAAIDCGVALHGPAATPHLGPVVTRVAGDVARQGPPDFRTRLGAGWFVVPSRRPVDEVVARGWLGAASAGPVQRRASW